MCSCRTLCPRCPRFKFAIGPGVSLQSKKAEQPSADGAIITRYESNKAMVRGRFLYGHGTEAFAGQSGARHCAYRSRKQQHLHRDCSHRKLAAGVSAAELLVLKLNPLTGLARYPSPLQENAGDQKATASLDIETEEGVDYKSQYLKRMERVGRVPRGADQTTRLAR